MSLYNIYMFNRAGCCLYYHEWSRPNFALADDPEEDKKLMFGFLFSLKDLTSKMSPRESKEGIHTIKLGNFTLHHFESLTGITVVLNTDNSVKDMYSNLQHLYSKVYVECVNRNPLHNPTHTTGQMINCAIFDRKVKQFLGEAVIKNSSSARS